MPTNAGEPEVLVCATLIGDIVSSKDHDSRSLNEAIQETLTSVDGWISPLQPLQQTLGDEFQGCFRDVSEAARASLLLRLRLLETAPHVDSRYGLGFGEVTIFQQGVGALAVQNGPGWWAAREAIERSEGLAQPHSRTTFARTWLHGWDQAITPAVAASTNAFLLCRDGLVEKMSPRQRRLLLGVMRGCSHNDLAEMEGIARSTVTNALVDSGAYAVLEGHRVLSASAT